jgi:serine/threonine-protein kinase
MPSKRLSDFISKHKKILLVLGGFIILFLFLNYVALPLYVNHGSRLVVPRLVGVSADHAMAMLDSAHLHGVKGETRPDPTYPAGTVVFQYPQAGAIVKEGRNVYLTISGGDVLVPVPLLRGKSARDARFALERNGLQLGAVTFESSETFPENTVVEQSVAADARIARGSYIAVVVSKGRTREEIAVPSVIGKTLSEAEKVLRSAGLKVGIVTTQPSFDLLPNTVVDQFPRPGNTGKMGQEVDLFVVRAGKPKEEIQHTDE